MPLFKSKKSVKEEKDSELERKLVLAHDDPEPTFDISSCGTKEVPSGVYSLCKVMRKEVLLMHDNAIRNLSGGGELKHLSLLRNQNSILNYMYMSKYNKVLDLHKNLIAELPEEIRFLTSLQVLNLSHNCLKSIHKDISKLQLLQTLDLQGNNLKNLPIEIGEMKSLRTLNISHNNVTRLPSSLANVRTLENLIVDVDKIIFPSKEIAAAGTAEMMKKLCIAAGIEYVPPSKCLLHVLDNYPSNTGPVIDSTESKIIEDKIQENEKGKERKRMELLTVEQQVLQTQEEQAILSAMAKQRHEDLLKRIAEDDTETNEKFLLEQKKKEKEIVHNLTALENEEQLANDRVAAILRANDRSKRTEEILEEMERERIETENLLKISQGDAANLRKKEVLENMNALLQSEQSQEIMLRDYEAVRKTAMSKALQSMLDESRKVDELLNEKDKDQSKLIKKIENEELAQMEAFHVLQMQTDAKHQRITNQIDLLEKELKELSYLEMERRQGRQEEEMRNLESNRQVLIDLFMQLLEERQKREEELTKRLVELEERREGDVEDYWLIQFQRLMDHKPETLVMKERECDTILAEVLAAASADDYVANFVRNKITWKVLREMKDENLKQIGIHEYGVRWKILKAVESRINEEDRTREKERKLDFNNKPEAAVNDDPPAVEPQDVLPSAPPIESIEVNQESACVICMEAKRDVIFLVCGHVCCCSRCSKDLKECPMCRQTIVKTVRMFMV